jgi:hypothetical protein
MDIEAYTLALVTVQICLLAAVAAPRLLHRGSRWPRFGLAGGEAVMPDAIATGCNCRLPILRGAAAGMLASGRLFDPASTTRASLDCKS